MMEFKQMQIKIELDQDTVLKSLAEMPLSELFSLLDELDYEVGWKFTIILLLLTYEKLDGLRQHLNGNRQRFEDLILSAFPENNKISEIYTNDDLNEIYKLLFEAVG